MKIQVKYWGPVIVWVSFISWMSTDAFAASNTSRIIEPILRYLMPHISQREVHLLHGVIRKLAHVTEYFILGFFLYRALRSTSTNPNPWRRALYSLLAVALVAAGDEFHQSFVATRTASFIDVGIDAAGGFLAQCAILFWNRLHRCDT